MTQFKKKVKVQKSLNDTLTCRWCDAGVCRERWWCSVALVSLGARLADSSYRKCQRGSPTTGSSPTTFHGNHAHLHNTQKKTKTRWREILSADWSQNARNSVGSQHIPSPLFCPRITFGAAESCPYLTLS